MHESAKKVTEVHGSVQLACSQMLVLLLASVCLRIRESLLVNMPSMPGNPKSMSKTQPSPPQPTEARAISCSKSSMITEERLIECLGPNRLNLLQP